MNCDVIADAGGKEKKKKKGGSFQTVSALFRVRAVLYSPVPAHFLCRTQYTFIQPKELPNNIRYTLCVHKVIIIQ